MGAQLWTPLTIDNGILYFGSDRGNVHALNTATQTMQWTFATGGLVRSAVTIAGSRALAASDDGFLYALNAATGEEAWRFDLGSADLARRLPDPGPPYEYDYRHSTPVVADHVVYVGSATGTVFAIDPATGREIWQLKTGGKVRATPTVDRGTVYVGSWDGKLYAVAAASGEVQWTFDTGGVVQGGVAIIDEKVVVGSRSAKLFAVNRSTGELEWEHVHQDGSWVESTPVVNEGVIYIGSSDSLHLFALDPETGSTRWKFKTQGWSWGVPVVAGDAVYIGGVSAAPYYFEGVVLERGFYAVDRATGALRWKMAPEPIEGFVNGGVFAPPAVHDGVVYVAALDGWVYALAE